ncbi:hypothetical protein [Paenibacillus silviterrae]|nr:hypothetical protein [Paenibacillus chinjuensis]
MDGKLGLHSLFIFDILLLVAFEAAGQAWLSGELVESWKEN